MSSAGSQIPQHGSVVDWPSGWFDPCCSSCPRLARFLADVGSQYAEYHAAPVPPFGDPSASLLVVGLAPGMHGANRTGRPFTGDHAGILLYETLYRYGFATSPVSLANNDGLRLIDCRLTNAVKCLPPQNKPLTDEVNRCNRYLKDELGSLPPDGVVVALGTIAHRAVVRATGGRLSAFPFAHGAEHRLAPGLLMVDSYHCSRYNTQTKRLTPGMFAQIFQRASELVGREVPGGG
jgi:uracil-DNA glycosylase family 4